MSKPEILQIGRTTIKLWESFHTETIINGRSIPASPSGDPAQKQTALELGYGENVGLMCREHEIAHTLVCWLMGIGPSPVLEDVAEGRPADDWHWQEESAALALQRCCRSKGVSIIGLARQIAQIQRSQASVARQLKEGK